MDSIPNEIFIQIFEHLDAVSYVSFLNTGYRCRQLIDEKQYSRMKEQHMKYLKKKNLREGFRSVVENKDFGNLNEMGVNTQNIDTSSLTDDIGEMFVDNFAEFIEDDKPFISKIPAFIQKMQTMQNKEVFQEALAKLGQSFLDNGGRNVLGINALFGLNLPEPIEIGPENNVEEHALDFEAPQIGNLVPIDFAHLLRNRNVENEPRIHHEEIFDFTPYADMFADYQAPVMPFPPRNNSE